MIEDLRMALKYTQDAQKTKPPCPILTVAALSIYKNLVNDLQKRIDQHEQWIRDELESPPDM